MADYFVQTVVHQSIPEACMSPLERWLLTCIFAHESDDSLYFFAEESPGSSAVLERDEIASLIVQSREQSPRLCEAVEKEIDGQGDNCTHCLIEVDYIGHELIFQEIVRRHPDKLPYVSIEQALTCTKMRPDGFGGVITLITPDEIVGTSTQEWLAKALKERNLDDDGKAPDDGSFDNRQACLEGWGIFDCGGSENGPCQICKCDDDDKFKSDDEVWTFVIKSALAGSTYHRSAIDYVREHNPIEYEAMLKAHPELTVL